MCRVQRFLFMHWWIGHYMRRGNIGIYLTFLLILAVLLPSVGSHSPGALTTNIKQSEIQPNTASILVGDSVYWINLDSRENVTHRVVYDVNGDGLYNGTGEWDSGILSPWSSNGTCTDETGNKTPGCAVTFELFFNETGDIGTYEYTNIIYLNGTEIENRTFTISVNPDTHLEAINTYCFGDDCEEDEEPTEIVTQSVEKPYWLLYISGGTGVLALLLGLRMIFSSPK